MAITGIDTLDGKQIIAAGASSAVKAAQDGNGNIITATYQPTAGMSNYQTTAGMSNYQTTAGMSNYATTASVTGKQDALTFGYTDNQISQINGSGIYSQGGGASYTGNVQEALDKVYTDSASWDNVSAKQDKLTFNYDGSNNITGINSSAIGGGGTQVVTSIKTKSYYGRTVITGVNDAESMITAYGREYAVDTNSYYFTSFNGSGISAGRAYGYINGSNSFVPFYQVGSSAMSGCAASAYIKNNVTGNITNWNAVTTIVSSNSADWNNVSAKEDKLTFAYDASDNITAINSSAIAGGSTPVVTATGGDGTYVTSINEMPLSGAGGGGGGGSQNVLILTGTQCLTANGGPIYIRKNNSTWKYVTQNGQYFNDPITSDNVLKNAMVVIKEISNGYSSFDVSLDLSGVGSQGLQTGTRSNSAPFNISGYTAAIPVSSPVTNYANNNAGCISGVYTLWTGNYVACYTNNSNSFNSGEQLRQGYTHWEVHGFVS